MYQIKVNKKVPSYIKISITLEYLINKLSPAIYTSSSNNYINKKYAANLVNGI